MIADVTAGCSSTNACARWVSDSPASSAIVDELLDRVERRWLPGRHGRTAPASARPRASRPGPPRPGGTGRPASRRRAGSTGSRRSRTAGTPGAPTRSMPRIRIEYGGCSLTNRSRSRCSRRPLRLDDVVGRERRVPDRAHLALVDEIAERAERLVDVGCRIGPVDLVQVDVVGAEAAQAVLALLDDPAARLAAHVRVVAHRPVNFVASTTSSRRPARALPTISSDSPAEYTSAVSTKLMPASNAVCIIRDRSRRGRGCPTAPNIIAPRQSGLTRTPLRPVLASP